MHRINWDVRYDMPPAFIHYMAHVTGAVPGDTHWGGEGPLVIPGVYTLRMNVDGKILTQTVTVKNDPGSRATAADLAALHDLQMKLYNGTRESWDGFQQIAAMRAAIAGRHPRQCADGRGRRGGRARRQAHAARRSDDVHRPVAAAARLRS